MLKKEYVLNLRYFDGAPAVGGASDGGSTPTGEANTSVAGKMKGAKAPTVLYGKQPEDEIVEEEDSQAASEGTAVTQPDPEARKAEYMKLRQGNYKDLFDEDVQNIINKRFKETKTLQKQLGDMQPILEILGQRYNVNDPEGLAKAIQEDTSLFEEEALEKGMTVDQLQYMKRMERENRQLRKSKEEENHQRQAQAAVADWDRQANELKASTYPNFDWRAEVDHPATGEDFKKVLQATNNVKVAYQAVHFDEILPNAMILSAQKAQEATVKSFQSRSARPSENGISSQTGVIVKKDVRQLSPEDRKAIAKRVNKGEDIRF